jgi:hypothetical protein
MHGHGWPCPGHPRSCCTKARKTWMPGSSPGMTDGIDSQNMHPRFRGAMRPKFSKSSAPKNRGRRECRMRAAPAISCAVAQNKVHTSIQGSGEHPTFPAQWLYGLWRALLGESMLCCHRRPSEALASSELDARLRASGPHVFAVRSRAVRYRHYQRPPRPVPTILAIMMRPSGGTGWVDM